VGPSDDSGESGGGWYFSLNNRRLWVLKRCREEGLLSSSDDRILVRVRRPKSATEAARYSLENCALEAKIIRERKKDQEHKSPRSRTHQRQAESSSDVEETNEASKKYESDHLLVEQMASLTSDSYSGDIRGKLQFDEDGNSDDGSTTSSGSECYSSSNPFSALS